MSSPAAAASAVLTELTFFSGVEWLSAIVLHLTEESAPEAGADLTGLAAATGDELSVVLDADFDIVVLQ